MKNLYPKGKGKIHPSPSPPSAVAGGAGGSSPSSSYDALAVLKLLPAAILALTVALGLEEQEVLAYLVTQSLRGPAAAVGGSEGLSDIGEGEKLRFWGAAGVAHRPMFDCGCFDCYTSFWSRWDCSPDRELIHQAIEAFEEHLASSEKVPGSRNRRKERKAAAAAGERSDKRGKKGKEKERKKKSAAAKSSKVAAENEKVIEERPATAVCGVDILTADAQFLPEAMIERKAEIVGGEERREEVVTTASEADEPAVVGGERRRGWPDVMWLFNLRLWSLWSPAA